MTGHGVVDLRSDTVTTPTAEMRRAMAEAEVGDDCYREDPTVNRLQEMAAEVTGKAAALYVPTGTMANQICLKLMAQPGAEVICHEGCHLIHHESGASAMLAQVQLVGLPGDRGLLDPADVADACRPDDVFQPDTHGIAIENTHNAAGGTVWPLARVREVAAVAHERGIPLFCDGARMFNAVVASGVSAAELSAPCDVVTFSLYKGLAAPMGSLICGAADAIERAWLYRRIYGGAMRQAGIVAAAGVVALETMVERLDEDHDHALLLASGIAAVAPEGSVDPDAVQTNMVVFDANVAGVHATAMLAALRAEGVLAGLIAPGVVRFVTHKDVDRRGIDRAVVAFATALKELRSTGAPR